MNGERLDPSIFRLDPRMASGWYSDHYFKNVVSILSALAEEGYRFGGKCARLEEKGFDIKSVDVGNLEVEMQYFTKRRPFSIACGIDHAIAILKSFTGCFDEKGKFHNMAARLEVQAVHDGAKLAPWLPALRVRGRYRDFAILETPTLGVMARRTRIATNVYETLVAANGKPVFFFPARFDIPEAQAGDGYAYKVAVERYNMDENRRLPLMVTTEAQGDWWGEKGGGTTSHSYILSFLGDTTEAMMQFARVLPADVKRIALVDTMGDCVGDSVRCALAFFRKYRELKSAGNHREAEKYVLFGVRCDTAAEVRDISVEPLGEPALDFGVVPRLVTKLRHTLDHLDEKIEVQGNNREDARRYFRNIKIIVSGGFDPDRIRNFERLGVPADIYGVGSYLIRGESNDFTADIVRVRLAGEWVDLAKVGRKALENGDLENVAMS